MFDEFGRRFWMLFRRGQLDADLDEEMRLHRELRAQEQIERGLSAEEAHYAAQRRLGNDLVLREESRDMWSFGWIETLLQDIRHGLRGLRKNPGFTAVAVLTLALGIGANTAIFSILESQLWRPLPFPHSKQLMDVHLVLLRNPKQRGVLPERVFNAWREQSRSFANLAGYLYPGARNLAGKGISERLPVMAVTSNLFDTLEVPPTHGRGFLRDDEAPGRDRVAILSHALWQDRFASDPTVLGKPITLDGENFTVVGVASPLLRFEYLDEPAIFVPVAADTSTQARRSFYVVGRLAQGMTPSNAREELTVIFDREMKAEGIKPEDAAAVKSLRETWTDYAAPPLYFFAGAVGFILLIACVNTAGLLLARGLTRQREFALRAALGAGPGRLIRQLLVESMILAVAGSVAGAVAGVWLARWVAVFLPPGTSPRHALVTLDERVFLFALAACVASAVLVGLAPAIFASRANLNDALRQAAPGRSTSRGQHYVRSSLVTAEVALGLVLLFATGLFLSSFLHLEDAPRGFDAPGSLTFRVSLRGDSYAKPGQIMRYFDRLTNQLRSLPGVQGVTLGSRLPLTGASSFACVNVVGRPPLRQNGYCMDSHSVKANYFDLLHMHLLAGRAFGFQDVETSPRVVILNRNAVHDLFGSENPLGKVLEYVPDTRRGVPAEPPVEIIGVVENFQEFGADELPFGVMFAPFPQHPDASEFVLVSSSIPRGALAGAIRATASALDKNQPVFDMKTMDNRVSDSLQGARFDLYLVAALAATALILVSVGTFGTFAYFVQQRTQEFGIRLALGATPAGVLAHAIGQALGVGLAGVSIGVAASLVLGRLLRHALYLVPHEHMGMLYGVEIYDPSSMICSSVLLITVLLLASFIPARRAAKVDPVEALKYE